MHRVAEIIQTDDKSNNNSSRIIRTKGDANPSSIPGIDYPIREQDYIGKVVYVIPSVGLITKVFRPPVNYIIIISVTLTILLFLYIRKGKRREGRRINNLDSVIVQYQIVIILDHFFLRSVLMLLLVVFLSIYTSHILSSRKLLSLL